jgi:hypothetical protein
MTTPDSPPHRFQGREAIKEARNPVEVLALVYLDNFKHVSNLGNSHRNVGRDPTEGAGGALLFAGALGLLVLFASSAAAVFAASIIAGAAVILVIALTAIIAAVVYRKQQRVTVSLVLLGLSALWAALGGIIVFKTHSLAFAPAAWVLNVLFAAALLSVWSTINTWLKALAALFAFALFTATVFLPRPPGGDGPLDTAEEWSIDVEVKDDHGEPLQGALVLCGTVMRWKYALGLDEALIRETDRHGRVPTWKFIEDPRFKIVICNASKTANDGNAGYPPVTQFVLSIAGGGESKLDFALVENPHLDIAFLELDLSGDYGQRWFILQFELWAGEGSAQPFQTKAWNELRGNGFAIPAATATQDLHLRYHYEGPGGEGLVPPYNELRTIHLGAIEPGTRKRLSLRIPDR